MLYAEAAYFDGHHCAHVAAWEEHRRLQRLRRALDRANRRGVPVLPFNCAGGRRG